jgi:hypothetical protein
VPGPGAAVHGSIGPFGHRGVLLPDLAHAILAVQGIVTAAVTAPAVGWAAAAYDDITRGQMALMLDRLSGTGTVAPSVNAALLGGLTADQLRGQRAAAGASA